MTIFIILHKKDSILDTKYIKTANNIPSTMSHRLTLTRPVCDVVSVYPNAIFIDLTVLNFIFVVSDRKRIFFRSIIHYIDVSPIYYYGCSFNNKQSKNVLFCSLSFISFLFPLKCFLVSSLRIWDFFAAKNCKYCIFCRFRKLFDDIVIFRLESIRKQLLFCYISFDCAKTTEPIDKICYQLF